MCILELQGAISCAMRIWSRETGSAVPSRISLFISILRLNLVLTYGIPPDFRGGVHLFILNRHRMSGGRLPKRIIVFGNLEGAVRRGRGGKEKE